MSGGGGGGIRGYWYFLGLHMGIGRGPVNSIVEMRVGDKTAVRTEVSGSGVFPIYEPTLFGGEEAEGGVGGACYVMMGEPDQTAPDDLALMLGGGVVPAVLPGFRRMATLFFNGFIGAINPYPKPWKFRVRRSTKGWDGEPWYPETCMIQLVRAFAPAEITSSPFIHAMNPAHIIYEVLTNREWGRGLPRAAIDDANFRAVADQLYAEAFGLCLRWTRSDGIDSFIQNVLDTIGAVMRPNISTGELQLKLLRDDYVFEDLPLYTSESGLLEVTEASVAAMPAIMNHVLVKYKDPITGKDASVGTHNLAGVQGAGGEINTLNKEYPGIPTPDLAGRVALRDLRLSSNALRRFTITLDRRGEDVRPGDVIRIKDVTRGIPDMAVRIGRFEDGPMTDGRISLTAVQDVFSLRPASYIGIQPPDWEGGNTTPCIGLNRSFELPYYLLARNLNAADLDYVPEDAGYLAEVVELGARPLNAGYRLAVKNGAPTDDEKPPSDANFCPTVPPGWDGGDCIEVITGPDEQEQVVFEWELTVDKVYEDGDYFLNNTRGVLTQTAEHPYGTVSGPQSAERFLQFLTTVLSDPWPEPFTQLLFSGLAAEEFTKMVLNYQGINYTLTISAVEDPPQDPLPGFDTVYAIQAQPNLFPLPAIGDKISAKVYHMGLGRTLVPCGYTPGESALRLTDGSINEYNSIIESSYMPYVINGVAHSTINQAIDYPNNGSITSPQVQLFLGAFLVDPDGAPLPAEQQTAVTAVLSPSDPSDSVLVVRAGDPGSEGLTINPPGSNAVIAGLSSASFAPKNTTFERELTVSNAEGQNATIKFEYPICDVGDIYWSNADGDQPVSPDPNYEGGILEGGAFSPMTNRVVAAGENVVARGVGLTTSSPGLIDIVYPMSYEIKAPTGWEVADSSGGTFGSTVRVPATLTLTIIPSADTYTNLGQKVDAGFNIAPSGTPEIWFRRSSWSQPLKLMSALYPSPFSKMVVDLGVTGKFWRPELDRVQVISPSDAVAVSSGGITDDSLKAAATLSQSNSTTGGGDDGNGTADSTSTLSSDPYIYTGTPSFADLDALSAYALTVPQKPSGSFTVSGTHEAPASGTASSSGSWAITSGSASGFPITTKYDNADPWMVAYGVRRVFCTFTHTGVHNEMEYGDPSYWDIGTPPHTGPVDFTWLSQSQGVAWGCFIGSAAYLGGIKAWTLLNYNYFSPGSWLKGTTTRQPGVPFKIYAKKREND